MDINSRIVEVNEANIFISYEEIEQKLKVTIDFEKLKLCTFKKERNNNYVMIVKIPIKNNSYEGIKLLLTVSIPSNVFKYVIIPLQNRTNVKNNNDKVKCDLIRNEIIKVNLESNKIKIILDLNKIRNLSSSRLITDSLKAIHRTYFRGKVKEGKYKGLISELELFIPNKFFIDNNINSYCEKERKTKNKFNISKKNKSYFKNNVRYYNPDNPYIKEAKDGAFRCCENCYYLNENQFCSIHETKVNLDNVCKRFYYVKVYRGGGWSPK
ncbi:hypothetical protein SAMN02745883_02382 [Caminicella sporogenes DSM 14501]|uniref:Uncharacterized protein n=1 Tax=Caminicella sporogenes DSM 14501 TaxID=1121266 RepID=A0A1M6TLG1_9FIRM|nr:hypothetical protein [Caminicella sporogenes]RKD22339.1 hypothetical protein BET04_04715 [Caminicella sporogenes]SHK57774.1 hypothetical protein SAMN02745883_02382 [Caminicella sporogenes DSM 14501]